MTKRLRTDQQFEHAYLIHSTVYVRDKGKQVSYLGSLEAFNPILVTVSGKRFVRDDYEFLIVDS
jgi:hypothetical protein